MTLLLDTHIFVWVALDSSDLDARHKAIISGNTGNMFVSAVTGWEVSTKHRIGKWPEVGAILPDLETWITRMGFSGLPLTVAQAALAGGFATDHKDPFDRMLAAQALDLDLTLITVDPAFQQFGCKVA